MTEPGLQSHFYERQIILCQQRLGSLDAKLNEVLMWRGAGCLFEFARKMKAAHAGDLGQLGEFDVPAVIRRNELRYMAQPSGG